MVDAIWNHLRTVPLPRRDPSLRDLVPEAYPVGNERLSEEIDAVTYGVSF